jgi:ferric-dicitrate binding protein FerR (iron transport regulator)
MLGFLRYVVILLLMLVSGTSQAQTPENCELQRLTEPDRHVLRCTGGLFITLDAAAQIGLLADPNTPPRVIELRRGSILIDVEPGSAAVQVQARHAIAAVRGTEFAVEETAEESSVFVVSGRVRVTRRGGGFGAAILEAGEGIDVAPGRPLQVNTWGQARVDELLSRFGR